MSPNALALPNGRELLFQEPEESGISFIAVIAKIFNPSSMPKPVRMKVIFGGMIFFIGGIVSLIFPIQSIPNLFMYVNSGQYNEYVNVIMNTAGFKGSLMLSRYVSPLWFILALVTWRFVYRYLLQPQCFASRDEYDLAPMKLAAWVIIILAAALYTLSGVLDTKINENSIAFDATKPAVERESSTDFGFTKEQLLIFFEPNEVAEMERLKMVKSDDAAKQSGISNLAQKSVYLSNFRLESEALKIESPILAVMFTLSIFLGIWAARYKIFDQYEATRAKERLASQPTTELGKDTIASLEAFTDRFKEYVNRGDARYGEMEGAAIQMREAADHFLGAKKAEG